MLKVLIEILLIALLLVVIVKWPLTLLLCLIGVLVMNAISNIGKNIFAIIADVAVIILLIRIIVFVV